MCITVALAAIWTDKDLSNTLKEVLFRAVLAMRKDPGIRRTHWKKGSRCRFASLGRGIGN